MPCPDANRRFFTMAEAYDRMAPLLVPRYDSMEEEALQLLRLPQDREATVVDLGAGSGRFIERVLDGRPLARCWWVDYSEDFLAVARRRLERFGDRVGYALCSFDDDWEPRVGAPVDAVFSMSAIHHLESDGKRALYRRCHDALKPGGRFLNCDEMRAGSDDAYRASLQFWVDHVEAARRLVTEEDRPYCEEWCAHFENWKARNVDGIDRPKSAGDDLHDPVTAQIEWLREVGFQQVDVFVAYHLWYLIGGRRGRS